MSETMEKKVEALEKRLSDWNYTYNCSGKLYLSQKSIGSGIGLLQTN